MSRHRRHFPSTHPVDNGGSCLLRHLSLLRYEVLQLDMYSDVLRKSLSCIFLSTTRDRPPLAVFTKHSYPRLHKVDKSVLTVLIRPRTTFFPLDPVDLPLHPHPLSLQTLPKRKNHTGGPEGSVEV